MGLYTPGRLDPFKNQQRRERERDAANMEANRPTGTELGQITRKLQEITAELKRQQQEHLFPNHYLFLNISSNTNIFFSLFLNDVTSLAASFIRPISSWNMVAK